MPQDFPNYGLKNKLCLVTGGSYGIGQSIVESFIAQGAHVISIARNATRQTYAEKFFAYDCDLLDPLSAEKCINSILIEVGIPDIIIHNLGGSCQITSEFASSDEWEKVWRFNLGIAIDLNNKFLPLLMKNSKPGKIIHLTSSAVKTSSGYAAYVSSKAALNSYIKTIALKFSQHNILINGVSPGAVKLPGRYFSNLAETNPSELNAFLDNHVSVRRLANPSEISAVVLFLASSFASYITGSIIDVDGGII